MSRKKRKVKDYLQHAQEVTIPAMEDSAFAMVIGADKPDAKICLEVGAAVMYDKPLILLIPPGRQVSANLKRVATAIVEGDSPKDPAVMKKLQHAIEQIMEHDERVRKMKEERAIEVKPLVQ